MTVFRVTTWNVENLFRPAPGAPQDDQDRYLTKLAFLNAVITFIDPDVLALQEIGGDEPLLDLQQTFLGAYPHRIASLFPDQRGIRVAFLSKHAPVAETHFADFPPGPTFQIQNITASGGSQPVTRMGRGALHMRVVKEALSVDLMTAHLKSKLLSFPRPGGSSFQPRDENERTQVAGIALLRRTAEAATLRIRINAFLEHNALTPLVLLGDFNDVPEAQTSLILTGPPGSEIGTGGFHRPDQGDDARLFNLGYHILLERRFSRIHHGRGELLDQIYVSEEMLPFGPDDKRLLPQVDSLIDFADRFPSVSDNPNLRADEIVPDHAPVTATFDL